ncbi:MAG: phytoene/squalene synthase family protein [Dongiaceae bacterium]
MSSDSAPVNDFCLDAVRRGDRDRYLTVLFAPAERRSDLLALYAFNLEIARARESVSEPMLGLIRLQWWRDSLDQMVAGEPIREHPVAVALARAIGRHNLPREPFERLLLARERDMDAAPLPDHPALIDYAEATTAPLLELAAQILIADSREDAATRVALREIAIGYALTGLLRAIPFHAAAGRAYLPEDAMQRAGLAVQDLIAPASAAKRSALVAEIAAVARAHLDAGNRAARSLSRALRPVLLSGTIARAHLRRLERAGFDPLHSSVQQSPPWTIWSLMLRSLFGGA